jgi:uncharacterized membrane protein YeaQ/YmgE (transglycosylase-associated protein family)
MNLLLTIVLGGIAGWVASVVMHRSKKQGMLMDIVLGVVGSFVGGYVMTLLGQPGVTGFNLYSLAVSIGGACLVIAIGRAIK